jgi:holo-[acyl-carrier protein] synthase
MIYGVGTDLVQQDRIQRSLDRFGDRFVQRLLLQQELDAFQKQKNPTRFLAMRFAAKEAVVKAMGTGFAHGMWVRDVGTIQNEWGRPEIIYSQRGEAMCRKLGIGEGHISLTDEAGFIVAFAVLMRVRD